MTARKLIDYNLMVERFVLRFFQKGIVNSVGDDLMDEELSGSFKSTNGVRILEVRRIKERLWLLIQSF